MTKFANLYERREAISEAMKHAAASGDIAGLMRLTADHQAVSYDIDRMRSAVARHIGQQIEQLSAEVGK
jgi:hypothetical protein